MNDFRTHEPPEQQVAVCEACGGTYFYETPIHRYAADAYSAVLGGELRAIEDHVPKSIRMCICGRPAVPVISGGLIGRSATEANSVISIVEGAVQTQKKITNDIAALTKGAATARRVDELAARIKALEELIGTKDEKTGGSRKTKTKGK
jgi:hypothetical protein